MTPFRGSILAWSTFSGALLGMFVGIAAATALYALSEVLADRWAPGRLRVVVAVLCLVLLPLAGAVLGFLEGRLKLR